MGRFLTLFHTGFSEIRTPDLTVPGYEIYSLLFGPSSQVISPWSAQLGALNCWFPAPFFIHNTDRF